MGEAFISRRGGGPQHAADGYALICVRYPAQSDCFCEKSGESYSVRNGYGTAAFAVSGAGTWTVSCTDGTQSASDSVSVTSAGELKEVRISYSSEPELGDGVLLSAQGGLRSGYSVSGNAVVTGNAIVESGTGGFYISPPVDLSDYSTLTVSCEMVYNGGQGSCITVAGTPEKAMDTTLLPERVEVFGGYNGYTGTVSIDVSGLSGSYYIGSANAGSNLRVTAIALT